MAQSTNKKVLLARFDREAVEGFVQSAGGFGPGTVDLLTPSGNLVQIPVADTKAICFVRDFEQNGVWPLAQKTFLARPKTPGVWVRLRFRDGDAMEGVISNNLLLVEPEGFLVQTPDSGLKCYILREALVEVQVLGVIGSPLKRRGGKAPAEGQLEMFSEG